MLPLAWAGQNWLWLISHVGFDLGLGFRFSTVIVALPQPPHTCFGLAWHGFAWLGLAQPGLAGLCFVLAWLGSVWPGMTRLVDWVPIFGFGSAWLGFAWLGLGLGLPLRRLDCVF